MVAHHFKKEKNIGDQVTLVKLLTSDRTCAPNGNGTSLIVDLLGDKEPIGRTVLLFPHLCGAEIHA